MVTAAITVTVEISIPVRVWASYRAGVEIVNQSPRMCDAETLQVLLAYRNRDQTEPRTYVAVSGTLLLCPCP